MRTRPLSWSVSPRALLARQGMARGRSRPANLWHPPEQLEPRRLLATINWDGGPGGQGTDFNDPVNWVGNVLPGPADDAVVISADTGEVVISQSISLLSLFFANTPLNHTGGVLTLAAESLILDTTYILGAAAEITGAGDIELDCELIIEGGMLSGSGSATLAATRSATISTGTIARNFENLGTLTIASSGCTLDDAELTNAPGATLILEALSFINGAGLSASLINQGTVEVLGEVIEHACGWDGLAVSNAATGQINVAEGMLFWGGSGAHSQDGTISVGSGANVLFTVIFGSVVVGASSSLEGAGSIRLSNQTDIAFPVNTFSLTGGANLQLNTTLSLADDVTFNGPVTLHGGSMLTTAGNITFNALVTLTGVMNGAGDIEFNGNLNLYGTLSGGGAASLAAGRTANVGSSALLLRDFDNYGSMVCPDGLDLAGTVTFTNKPGGELRPGPGVSGDGDDVLVNEGEIIHRQSLSLYTGLGHFTNAASGVISINPGGEFPTVEPSVLNLSAVTVSMLGLADIDGLCTLVLGTATHGSGSSITGAGDAHISDPQTLSGDTAWCPGSLTFDGVIIGPGDLALSDTVVWSGVAGGTGVINLSDQAYLAFEGGSFSRDVFNGGIFFVAAEMPIDQATFTNLPGAFLYMALFDIDGSNNAGLVNQGTLGVSSGVFVSIGGDLTFTNAPGATFSIAGGADLGLAAGIAVNLAGLVTVASGSALSLAADATFNNGAVVSGEGEFRFDGASVVTIAANTLWTAGFIRATQPVQITGSGDLQIGSADFSWGIIEMTGSGTTTLLSGGTTFYQGSVLISRDVTNLGEFSAATDIQIAGCAFLNAAASPQSLVLFSSVSVLTSGGGSFTSSGLITGNLVNTLSAAAGSSINISATGEIAVDDGLTFAGAGTITVNGGVTTAESTSVIAFSTSITIGAAADFSGPGGVSTGFYQAPQVFPLGTYSLTGGATLGDNSPLVIDDDVTFNGLVSIYYTFLEGAGDFTFAGGLTIDADFNNGEGVRGTGRATLPLSQTAAIGVGTFGRDFDVFGTLTGTGIFGLRSGATLTIKPGSVSSFRTIGGDESGSLLIQGTLSRAGAGDGGIYVADVTIASAGTFHVLEGTVESMGAWTIDGSVIIDTGATFQAGVFFRVNTFIWGPSATVSGAGTLTLFSSTHTFNHNLAFSGPVRVDGGPNVTGTGDLTFNGGLTVSRGFLDGTGDIIIPAARTLLIDDMPNLAYPGAGIYKHIANSGSFTIAATAADFVDFLSLTNNPGATFTSHHSVAANSTVDNLGSFTLAAGPFSFGGAFTNHAGATVNYDSVANITAATAAAAFSNHGTFNKNSSTAGAFLTGGGASLAFTNEIGGVINANNGDLIFNFAGTLTNLGLIDIGASGQATFARNATHGGSSAITGPGSIYFLSSAHIFSGQLQTTGGTTVSSSNLTFNADRTFSGGVASSASAISGSGNLTFNGGLSSFTDLWSGSGLMTIPAAATAALSGPVTISRPFNNLGTVQVLSATVTLDNVAGISGATLASGRWDISGTLSLPSGTALTTIGAAAAVTLIGPAALITSTGGGGGSTLSGLASNQGSLTLKNGAVWSFVPAGGVFTNTGTFASAGTGTVLVPASVTFNNGPVGPGMGGTIEVGSDLRGPGGGMEIDGPIVGGGIINIRATFTVDVSYTFTGQVNHFPTGTRDGVGIWTVLGTYNWFGGVMTGTGRTRVGSSNTLNMVEGVMQLAGGHTLENLDEGIWTGGCLAMNAGTFINGAGADLTITGITEVVGQGGENTFINEGDLATGGGGDTTFGSGVAYVNTGTFSIDAPIFYETDQFFDNHVILLPNGEISGPGHITFNSLFDWLGGAYLGPGTITVAPTGSLFIAGEDDKLLGTTFNHDAVGGIWTGGCLNMASALAAFNNGAAATLDIFANPQIDVNGPPTAQFNNAGLITVHTGEFVIHVGGTNSGTIIVIPPDTLIFTVTYTHAPGSMLTGPGGVAFLGGIHTFASGTFTVEGPVTLGPGASLTLPAASLPNYNASTHTFSGGDWSIGDGALLNLSGAEIWTIDANTSFTLSGNAIFTALNTLSTINGALTLTGGRDLAVNPADPITSGALVSNGSITLDPGSTLSTSGGYTQTGGASLNVRFSGNDAATMGVLSTGGPTSLAGHLDIAYAFNYTPPVYTNHRFLATSVHSSLVGGFATTSIPTPGTDLKAPLLTDAKGMRLLVSSIADWNNDADVGVPDIFAFLASWFAGNADINNDGSTNVPDIFAFLSRWFAAP